MHGFINSPALAKLVALQMIEEQVQESRRRRPSRRSFRARLLARRPAPRSTDTGSRIRPTGQLAEGSR